MAKHRAGRKKRKNVTREPNGRISRRTVDRKARQQETEAEIMATALAPRLRAGINPELARSLGTLEANLYALFHQTKGEAGISRKQYDAACHYLEARQRYLTAIDCKDAPNEPRLSSGTGDPEAYEKYCRAAVWAWDKINAMVQEAQNEIRAQGNLKGALDGLARGHIPTEAMLRDLRVALNAVDRAKSRNAPH